MFDGKSTIKRANTKLSLKVFISLYLNLKLLLVTQVSIKNLVQDSSNRRLKDRYEWVKF